MVARFSPTGKLVGQRPQQQRLAGALSPGDHDVLARPHRRPQELRQRPVDRRQPDQVVEVDVADPVPADHQLRPRHGLDHRRQPGPVRQPHGQQRTGGGQRPLGAPQPGGDVLQLTHQILVGVGDRADPDIAPIGVADPHVVVPVRLDVLHLRVIDVGLQPAEPELRGEHRLSDRGFFGRRGYRLPGPHPLSDQLVDAVLDERAGQLLLRHGRQGRAALELSGQRRRRRLVQPAHQRPVQGAGWRVEPSEAAPGGAAPGHGVSDHGRHRRSSPTRTRATALKSMAAASAGPRARRRGRPAGPPPTGRHAAGPTVQTAGRPVRRR